jgi:1-acyl-sn-glycerol-3-phosphate acyltransferase
MIGSLVKGAAALGTAGARAAAAAAADFLPGARRDPLEEWDPEFIRAILPSLEWATRIYFRSEVRGIEHIPADGPVLLVGNHSGGLLIADTFVFGTALYSHFGPQRRFHQLAHDVVLKLPGLAPLRRFGMISASHEHGEQALGAGAALLVYPGGDRETFRPTWESGQVDFGGRSGFVRLAVKKGVPIVPVVAIGGQETALFITRGEGLAKLLGLHRLRIKVLPIALSPPFGVTLFELPARLPLPSQITVQLLPPLDARARLEAGADEEEIYREVTDSMQHALDELTEERDLPVVGRALTA